MKSEFLQRVGTQVREYRNRLGMSQEELADRANVHRTYVGMIERAEKNMTITNLSKVCKALGVSLSEFLKDID